ncbi:hypothetical protein NFJ02_15g19680 [Pycnococcus provasolii]
MCRDSVSSRGCPSSSAWYEQHHTATPSINSRWFVTSSSSSVRRVDSRTPSSCSSVPPPLSMLGRSACAASAATCLAERHLQAKSSAHGEASRPTRTLLAPAPPHSA